MLKLSALMKFWNVTTRISTPHQDAYYFFDEIQYAAEWDKWLKTIYDLQPETKVISPLARPALY
ncbi:MAG: AAA family ATPase [Peptococcia bacterium]